MILVQDGFQAFNSGVRAKEAGLVDGIIWSLGDHRPPALAQRVKEGGFETSTQAVDPQFYVARIDDSNPKKIGDHGLFDVSLKRKDLSARRIPSHVEKVLGHQRDFKELTHLISPTVAISSMADRSAQTAVDFAEAAISYQQEWEGEERPLLISVAAEQVLLLHRESVDALLDELTSLEASGFYLLFDIPPRGTSEQIATAVGHALYVVNTLHENDYEVWVGYCGFGGQAFRAVGADAFGTGWFQKQRAWSTGNWTKGQQGRQPKPRAYLGSVWGSLRFDIELEPLRVTNKDLFDEVVSCNGPIAEDLRSEKKSPRDDFDQPACTAQLFAAMSEADRVLKDVSVEEDLKITHSRVSEAITRLERIEEEVNLEERSKPKHARAWKSGIEWFAQEVDIEL